MTLKPGEFIFVPLDGKSRKVLVTPPWEREQPKLNEGAMYEQLHKENEQLKTDFASVKAELLQLRTTPPASAQPPTAAPYTIEHQETIVTVQNQEPAVKTFNTNTGKGRVLYVILNDLKERPRSSDVLAAMIERGWNTQINTVTPDLAGLVRDGYLIKDENSRYRTPTRVRIQVVETQPC